MADRHNSFTFIISYMKKQNQQQSKKLPFIQEVLITIAADLADGYVFPLDLRRFGMGVTSEWYRIRQARRRENFESMLRNALRRLRKQGCITMKEQEKKLIATLTPKGWRRALRRQFRRSKQLPEGQQILVFFDIPESERTVRATFRRTLKEGGFRQVQKSVWASDRDVFDHLKRFIREYAAEQWITVCSTSDCFGARSKKW